MSERLIDSVCPQCERIGTTVRVVKNEDGFTKLSRLCKECGGEWTNTFDADWLAVAKIRRLEAEVEKLTRERDEARSKETDYREGFEEGWDAAQRGAAAVVKKLREALKEWDALIVHQFHGTRDAMSDMQRAALNTKRILDELDAREALEAQP